VIGISNDDFLLAVRSGNQPRQSTLRDRIREKIETQINKPFETFYTTERVCLKADFNSSEVCFLVRSAEGDSFQLSERSNGLKWYLNTFIDILANNLPNKNVVYLLDEPGISLHVNAQRELLQLLSTLASQGNQVVYTTHSPTMLDTDYAGLHRIRAVVKDEEGYSRIYKSAFEPGIMNKDRTDTLAPIIHAIGMNLSCVFGPGQNRINIVPEGMSDYIFLTTMAKLLHFDLERYTIIPTKGASNAINVCAILKGWGCPFLAIFDYDEAGVKTGGEDMQSNFGFSQNAEFCYLFDATPEDLEQRTYLQNKVEIEDLVGRDEIRRFNQLRGNSNELGKTLTAKLMCNAFSVGEFTFSDETLERFRTLFSRIESYTAKVVRS
jgi:predicted ATPase